MATASRQRSAYWREAVEGGEEAQLCLAVSHKATYVHTRCCVHTRCVFTPFQGQLTASAADQPIRMRSPSRPPVAAAQTAALARALVRTAGSPFGSVLFTFACMT